MMKKFTTKLTIKFATKLSLVALAMGCVPLAMADGEIAPFCLKNEGCAYFDSKGNRVIEPIDVDDAYSFADNGLNDIDNNNHWGFVDKKSKMAEFYRTDLVKDFSDSGLARVDKNGKHGFINKKGKIVIPMQFDATGNFKNGLAVVKKGNKMGYIDKTGKMVIALQFDFADDFAPNGLAVVQKNGRYGYINKTGEMVVPLQSEYAKGFVNQLAQVKKDGKWGLIDRTGRVVIPIEFDSIEDFSSQGLAKVKKNNQEGYIDRTGRLVIPFARDYTYTTRGNMIINENAGIAFNAQGEQILFVKNVCNQDVVVNKQGEVVIPNTTEEQICQAENERLLAKQRQKAEKQKRACDHVYIGQAFSGRRIKSGTLFLRDSEVPTTYIVTGFSAKTQKVTVQDTYDDSYKETTCTSVGANPLIE